MRKNSSMDFIWTGLENVDEALIESFDCGDYVFNNFLKENATVNANGLLYRGEDNKNNYIHCAEIRLFAIAKALRSNGDPTRNYIICH